MSVKTTMTKRHRVTLDQTSVATCKTCKNFIQSTSPIKFDGNLFCSDNCVNAYEERQMPTGQAKKDAESIGESAKSVITGRE